MLRYRPADRFAHTLDPRSKLLFQTAFVLGTVVLTSPVWRGVLTVVAGICVRAAGLTVREAVRAFRLPIALIALGPLVAGITVGSPWFQPTAAIDSAIAGYDVVLALLVAGAYIHSTPVRETQAAIQRLVPGRLGRFLGVGAGLLFRLLPVLVADLRQIRQARAARLGHAQGWIKRAAGIGILGLRRTFQRADHLSQALQARCFAWNPTLPALSWGLRDTLLTVFAIALLLTVALLPDPSLPF